MEILDKITQYRLERNWSEYQLAERSGLTQSTISSWYRKNMLPSIPSLEKICDAFGITDQQRKLLLCAARLNPEQYDSLLHFLELL